MSLRRWVYISPLLICPPLLLALSHGRAKIYSMNMGGTSESGKRPTSTSINITDKFLASERAACATLETRLRNLAERAASRKVFSEKPNVSRNRNEGAVSPMVMRMKSLAQSGLHLMNNEKENSLQVNDKDIGSRKSEESSEVKSLRDGRFRAAAPFSDISLESNIDSVNGTKKENANKQSNHLKEGDNRRNIPKSIPMTSQGKHDVRSKSPFSLEEEDIERVLGLIESLESRNIFLAQNLDFRDAEYKETRTRLEELEDVLTVAHDNEKNEKLSTAAGISVEMALLNEQLKNTETELKLTQQRLKSTEKVVEEKLHKNEVGSFLCYYLVGHFFIFDCS